MNIDLKALPSKLLAKTESLKPYLPFIFIMFALVLSLFLVFQVRMNVTKEPAESLVDEKILELKRPKIDQDIVDKIQQLEERNIEIKSLFEQARDNPFQD